jgi:catechol 2,3-dioxygenase-like lactoylglutathione lyase family enzyme
VSGGVLTRLDHLVILVRDLDRAVRGYEGLGFAVTPGGEHADGLTRNALIPFRDGSHLELGEHRPHVTASIGVALRRGRT